MSAAQETHQETLWGMLCHLTALTAYIGVPFGNIIGPLIVWLLKREESEFVDAEGKEALNFQISMTIYFIISAIFVILLIGFLMMAAVAVFNLVFVIIASVRASEGTHYTYPLTIRFLK